MSPITHQLLAEGQAFERSTGAGERLLPAPHFLKVVKDAFPALGITRLGRLTGLDRVGVPVWMAVRPNAENLSVTQGKGLDDTAAALSAIMESAELALAETPHPRAFEASPSQASALCEVLPDFKRYLRLGQSYPAPEHQLRWVEGLELLRGRTALVPEETVGLVDRSGLTFWQASDGLGTGGSLTEAAVHGLCELIERDAMGLWSFRSSEVMAARECDAEAFGDDRLADVAARIAGADLHLRLFDITTDLKVPAVFATVAPKQPAGGRMLYLDLASGSGAHPDPARAALRAVLEAAQTRLTTIAGARDDIAPEAYAQPLPEQLTFYCGPPAPARRAAWGSSGETAPMRAPQQLEHLLERLRAVKIGTAVLVSFDAEPLGFSACRMLVPELEQDPGTRNRRLGRRGLRAMMGGL